MKTILSFILVAVMALSAGCSESNEEPQDFSKTLGISKGLVWIDHVDTDAIINIIEGNGDFKIVYPKIVWVDGSEVNYSDAILQIDITDREISVRRTLLENKLVTAYFLLTDSKKQKKIFVVDTPSYGNIYNVEELEKALLKDVDFWNW